MIIDFNHPDFNKYWSILVNRFPNSPPHFQESIMRFIAQRVIDNGLKIENKSFVILENEDVKAGLYLPSVNNKNVKDALAYEIPGLVLEDNLTTKTKNLFINEFKNRYNDINTHKRFVLSVDRSKMRLYDADETQQNLMTDDTPVFDKTQTAERFKDFKIE